MTTLREAAQQALEALENVRKYDKEDLYGLDDDITALRTALAEPEQEPVAWANMRLDGRTPTMLSISQHPEDRANWVNPVPLYTHPPQRKPLTDEEIGSIEMRLRKYVDGDRYDLSLSEFARAIERAHGIGGEA